MELPGIHFPNPFNPVTNVEFGLPIDGNVSIKIYDITGKEVMTALNEFRTAGFYRVSVDASSLSSGVYFYKIEAGSSSDAKSFVQMKSMILLK